MRIGIDVSKLHEFSKNRGIGFYGKYLYESLRKYTDSDVFLLEQKTDISKFDIIHYPFFDLFFQTLPLNKSKPTVVTIHDVTPLIFPEHYPPGLIGSVNNFIQRLALNNAGAIITDSNSSKEDIVNFLGVKEGIIFPIYLSCAEHFRKIDDKKVLEKVFKKYSLPKKFALFAGSVNWNKNLINLTRACLEAKKNIVFIGSAFKNRESLNHPEQKSFKQFLQMFEKDPLVHILGYVEDEEVVQIMNLAEILLLPSYYEGFGLPIIEAQTCGLPVITSNVSSMSEVAGQGALFVDPNQIDKIRVGILKISVDEKLRNQLIERGFENSKKFSWKKVALETREVYDKVFTK